MANPLSVPAQAGDTRTSGELGLHSVGGIAGGILAVLAAIGIISPEQVTETTQQVTEVVGSGNNTVSLVLGLWATVTSWGLFRQRQRQAREIEEIKKATAKG